jgi:hypothetical protein
VSGKAASGGGLAGVRAPSGYKGVARGPTGGDSTGMDALKKAAGDAAGAFNRGAASSGLNEAANTAIPTGNSNGGLGAGQTGATDKPFGGDQNKDGKTVGESLAFLKQKAMQDAQIALWAKEQEAGDNKLEALKIRNSAAEAFTTKIVGIAADQMGCMINSGSSTSCPSAASATSWNCTDPATKLGAPPVSNVAANYQSAGCGPANPKATSAPGSGMYISGTDIKNCQGTVIYTNCSSSGKAPDGGNTPPPPSPSSLNGAVTGNAAPPQTTLKPSCDSLKSVKDKLDAMTGGTPDQQTAVQNTSKNIQSVLDQAKILVNIRDAIGSAPAAGANSGVAGVSNSGDCFTTGSVVKLQGNTPVASQLNYILNTGNSSLLLQTNGVDDRMASAVTATDPKKPDLDQLGKDVGDDSSGLIKNIATFKTDVGSLNTAYGTVDSTVMNAPDPLGLQALQTSLGSNYDQSIGQTASDAAKSVQNSYTGTGKTIGNLSTAANTYLAPQIDPLKNSAGAGGTLKGLVTDNGAMDTIGNSTGGQVPAPLTKATATPPQNQQSQPDGSTIKADLQKADADVKAAQAAMRSFTPDPTDKACANEPCKSTQAALNQAATSVAAVQADQTAINSAIGKAATQAGTITGATQPPAQQQQ